jgi:outer membrane protein assembly factor BamA
MLVASSAWAAQVAIQDSPETSYRLQEIIFEGGGSFSQGQLANAFNVQVGNELNDHATSQGLERIRQLYSANGYLNFMVVPEFQKDRDRKTVVLTLFIDEGAPFDFGRLFLAGDETRPGEADALRSAWAPLSGKRYNERLLSEWLVENATFLPNDEKSRQRFLEQHIDISTQLVDIQLTFP